MLMKHYPNGIEENEVLAYNYYVFISEFTIKLVQVLCIQCTLILGFFFLWAYIPDNILQKAGFVHLPHKYVLYCN